MIHPNLCLNMVFPEPGWRLVETTGAADQIVDCLGCKQIAAHGVRVDAEVGRPHDDPSFAQICRLGS